MSWELMAIRWIQEALLSFGAGWFAVMCARDLVFTFPLFLFIIQKEIRRTAFQASIAAVSAFGITFVVGGLLGRERPFRASDTVLRLISEPLTRFSLPSGHASISFAFAAAIADASPKWGWLAYLVATLVAFGRVAAGVHYPTDVLAGAVLGIASWHVVKHVFAHWNVV